MDQLTLAPIFQNHMMLQRDKPIHVWGQGPEDAWITVCLTGSRTMTQVRDHCWHCVLPPHPAAREVELTVLCDIPGFPVKKITDVSIGDIWLAGGQSNMEYFLRYDAHWEELKNTPVNPDIHMYNVPRLAFEGQQKDTADSGHWFREQDPAWETFSAPGYCFARAIQPILNIPVGIVGCNYGGTPACAWVPEDVLAGDESLNIFLREYEQEIAGKDPAQLRKETLQGYAYEDSPFHVEEWKSMMYGLSREEQLTWQKEHQGDPQIPMGPLHKWRPCGLYHQMIEDLAPFSLKGVLWYQGESDSGHASLYAKMFSSLISCWRHIWKDELPFLFVQLAPFGEWMDCDSTGYPEVRRCQELVSRTVPKAYMTSIMDLGMYWDIHPKHKKEVGERLALLARGKVYGEDLLCEPPEFVSARREENRLILTFSKTGTSLELRGNSVNGLDIDISPDSACPKEKPVLKSCSVTPDTLVLEFDQLPDAPLTIKFAETGYVQVNLFNSAGLPAKPFTCHITGK